jgi:hypothetical protein
MYQLPKYTIEKTLLDQDSGITGHERICVEIPLHQWV